MARKGRAPLRRLLDLVAQAYPKLENPDRVIRSGRVAAGGRILDNPATLVRSDATLVITVEAALRGERKLAAAIDAFGVRVEGRMALDLGAAAGGFTTVLLRRGAVRVYAVDVGFGQLRGWLRQDARVVNLERTNLSALDRRVVPDEVDVVAADLSYIALAQAIAQLNGRVRIARDADLIGLVKPQFELGWPAAPTAPDDLAAAVDAAARGIGRAGWRVRGTRTSPVRGSRGAVEFLLHAVRETLEI